MCFHSAKTCQTIRLSFGSRHGSLCGPFVIEPVDSLRGNWNAVTDNASRICHSLYRRNFHSSSHSTTFASLSLNLSYQRFAFTFHIIARDLEKLQIDSPPNIYSIHCRGESKLTTEKKYDGIRRSFGTRRLAGKLRY